MDDGSVEVIADATPKNLKSFEREINISMPYGPQVFNVERYVEGDARFPKEVKDYGEFVIER